MDGRKDEQRAQEQDDRASAVNSIPIISRFLYALARSLSLSPHVLLHPSRAMRDTCEVVRVRVRWWT